MRQNMIVRCGRLFRRLFDWYPRNYSEYRKWRKHADWLMPRLRQTDNYSAQLLDAKIDATIEAGNRGWQY